MPRITRVIAALGAASVVLALAACTPASEVSTSYITEGKLTIATGQPAYPPYVVENEPESGEGFEAAIAYAVAEQLGFAKDDVVWVRTGFEEVIQPGPQNFDINLQQFTISDERKAAVDFTSPYYATPQAVVTLEGTAAADADSIADLSGLLIGAASGTTSFTAIEDVIKPTQGAQVFNTNDELKVALQNGTVDAIVVDLPTAFFLTGVELDGGVLVGQLPQDAGTSDEWGILLAKDSPLTAEVTAAVDALRADGTLDAIADEWLGADAGAPVLN